VAKPESLTANDCESVNLHTQRIQEKPNDCPAEKWTSAQPTLALARNSFFDGRQKSDDSEREAGMPPENEQEHAEDQQCPLDFAQQF